MGGCLGIGGGEGGKAAAPPSLRGFAGREKGKRTPCRQNKREIKGGQREPARGWGRTLRRCLEIGEISVFSPSPPPPSVGSPTKNGAGGSVFPEEIIVHRDLSFILGVLGGGGSYLLGCDFCSCRGKVEVGGTRGKGSSQHSALNPLEMSLGSEIPPQSPYPKYLESCKTRRRSS